MMEEAQNGLMEYLAVNIRARKQFNMPRPEGYAYDCMEQFVLEEGTLFDHFSPRADRYMRRIPKHCFHNSYLAAVRSRGKLRYVEGYAYHWGLFPVPHAWNVDEDGGVVDTTWCSEDDHGIWPKRGDAYLGVIFPLDYVRQIRSNDNCSVIDQWQKGYPVLREKYALAA